MRIAFALALIISFTSATSTAQEESVQLKEAPERPLVVAHCSGCHSLDYIPMNAPFLDRKGWEAEVNKMINVMGAAVDPKQVPPLLDYLSRHYGK